VLLFCPSLAPTREKSFVAVHWCTWQDLAVRYAEKTEL